MLILIKTCQKKTLGLPFSKNEFKKWIRPYFIKKRKKTNTNETIGQSAEVAVCELNNISHTISIDRIDRVIVDKIKTKLKDFLNQYPNIKIIKWTASGGNKDDFKLRNGETLSLKTLNKNDGKICPQTIGQCTLNSWATRHFVEEERASACVTQNYSKHNKENSIKRWKIIKKNIISFLNKYLENTFCCNYLLLIYNCNREPVCSLLSKPKKFENEDIHYKRPDYEERWNEKKNKYSEFSTIIYVKKDNEQINIGEFQFHKGSRIQIKFRFCKTFLSI